MHRVQKAKRFVPKTFLGVGCFALGAALLPAPSTHAAPVVVAGDTAGDEAIKSFLDENTDAVIAIDVSLINLDQIDAWGQKLVRANAPDKATADKMLADSMKNKDQAKQWLADFSKAGGKRMYVLVNIAGLVGGGGPLIVAPIEGHADGSALAEMLKKSAADAGKAAPARPGAVGAEGGPVGAGKEMASAVVGRNVVFGSPKAVNAAKANPAAGGGNADLLASLASGGKAAVRVSVLSSALNHVPLPLPPEVKQVTQGLTSVSLSLSTPPTESAVLSLQAKDAAAAKQLSDAITQGLAAIKDNPDAKQALGDVGSIVKALAPATAGNKVTISLDANTIENVLAPMAVKLNAQMEDDDKPPVPASGHGARPLPGGSNAAPPTPR